MSPENLQRSDAAPPWASSWIIAAVALVLNWTVPGVPIPGPFETANSAPGLSSGVRAAQPGNLPRVQPRSVTADAGTPKPLQDNLNAGGKPKVALPAAATSEAPPAPSASRDDNRTSRTMRMVRLFDPRAPPAATA